MPSEARESVAEALRVLVVYDGSLARQRIQNMLARMGDRFSGELRFDSTFRRTDEVLNPFERTDVSPVELLVLATECSAALSVKLLYWLDGQLLALKANDGALAVLTGDNVPRQMDTLVVERFLGVRAERLRMPFIRGRLSGLGCPASSATPGKPGSGESASPRCHPGGKFGPASRIRIEKQRVGCTAPRAVTGLLGKMASIYKAQPPDELPDEFRTRLHQLLARRWMELHGGQKLQSM